MAGFDDDTEVIKPVEEMGDGFSHFLQECFSINIAKVLRMPSWDDLVQTHLDLVPPGERRAACEVYTMYLLPRNTQFSSGKVVRLFTRHPEWRKSLPVVEQRQI
jgi:hypothetical protein